MSQQSGSFFPMGLVRVLVCSCRANRASALKSPEKWEQVAGPECGETLSDCRDAKDKQDQDNKSVDQRSDDFAL